MQNYVQVLPMKCFVCLTVYSVIFHCEQYAKLTHNMTCNAEVV